MRGGTDYAKSPRLVLLLNQLRTASQPSLLVGAAVAVMTVSLVWCCVQLRRGEKSQGGRACAGGREHYCTIRNTIVQYTLW
jgi:hypothetical protein